MNYFGVGSNDIIGVFFFEYIVGVKYELDDIGWCVLELVGEVVVGDINCELVGMIFVVLILVCGCRMVVLRVGVLRINVLDLVGEVGCSDLILDEGVLVGDFGDGVIKRYCFC